MQDRLPRTLFKVLLFTLPLSIAITFDGLQINVPSEVIIGLLAILLFFVVDMKELRRSKFMTHPISLTSICYLSWMTVIVPFSSDVMISAKYMLVSIAHWWVFFVGFWILNKKNYQGIKLWLDPYAVGLCVVILYALINNYKFDFRPDASVLLAQPFYQDHALLGAVICMLIIYFLMRLYNRARRGILVKKELIFPVVFSVLALLTLYLIPSRAAWLSLMTALSLGLLSLAIKSRFTLLIVVLFVLGLGAVFLVPRLFNEPIKAEARKGNMGEQLKSTFNFTTDVSNLERLNRYHCALRMFLDRPITGFGAGTFATSYLPYQGPDQMTRISVTSPYRDDGSPHQEGRGGGAHSEYLQALSEGGVLGFVTWLALVCAVMITGFRIYFRPKKGEMKLSVLPILLGLVTYFVHGFFNNFLHAEELAVLFWAMLSYLVIIDLERSVPVKLVSSS